MGEREAGGDGRREIKFRARMAEPGVHEGIFVYMTGLHGEWHSKNGTHYGDIVQR